MLYNDNNKNNYYYNTNIVMYKMIVEISEWDKPEW